MLWVGTLPGSLVEVDLDNQHVAGHDVLAGSPVTALGATAAGEPPSPAVEAGSCPGVSARCLPKVHAAAWRHVAGHRYGLLGCQLQVPDDGDLETHLVLTDGARTWQPGDLAAATTATTTDPAWLQLRVAINNALGQRR